VQSVKASNWFVEEKNIPSPEITKLTQEYYNFFLMHFQWIKKLVIDFVVVKTFHHLKSANGPKKIL